MKWWISMVLVAACGGSPSAPQAPANQAPSVGAQPSARSATSEPGVWRREANEAVAEKDGLKTTVEAIATKTKMLIDTAETTTTSPGVGEMRQTLAAHKEAVTNVRMDVEDARARMSIHFGLAERAPTSSLAEEQDKAQAMKDLDEVTEYLDMFSRDLGDQADQVDRALEVLESRQNDLDREAARARLDQLREEQKQMQKAQKKQRKK